MRLFTISLLSLLLCMPAVAQMPPRPMNPPGPPQRPAPPPDQDPIGRELFPPDLIMRHQQELQLNDKQRAALREELVKLQTGAVDLQWQLSDAAERLATMLRATPIDEAKTLEQADKVMALEHDMKRLHLGALIRMKNLLTPEQLARLQEFRRRGE